MSWPGLTRKSLIIFLFKMKKNALGYVYGVWGSLGDIMFCVFRIFTWQTYAFKLASPWHVTWILRDDFWIALIIVAWQSWKWEVALFLSQSEKISWIEVRNWLFRSSSWSCPAVSASTQLLKIATFNLLLKTVSLFIFLYICFLYWG